MDFGIAGAGFIVGIIVGLTGMGGGALMTPILVIGFGIEPLAAVSSDLVAAVVMKPIGGGHPLPPRDGAHRTRALARARFGARRARPGRISSAISAATSRTRSARRSAWCCSSRPLR